MEFDSVDAILDFAIQNEEEAYQLYTDLAKQMSGKHMQQVFEGFAEEEKLHKAKLLNVKSGKSMLQEEGKVLDLKMSDYLVNVEAGDANDYQKALILAMKAEKKAYKLYTDIADSVGDPELKILFQGLALEEAKHKLRFETEYEDRYLTEPDKY